MLSNTSRILPFQHFRLHLLVIFVILVWFRLTPDPDGPAFEIPYLEVLKALPLSDGEKENLSKGK